MASRTAILSIRVVSDSKDAQKGMNDTASSVDKLERGLDRMSVPAGLAVAALGKVGKSAIDSASALQQSTGGVEAVFGRHAAEVQRMASQAAQNVGLATSQYQDMATIIGSQLKNMGTPMTEVAGQTDELITLGADLAATFGGTTADAVSALSSLMRGERDPIEAYGVTINQAAIDAQKAAMGLDGLTGAADTNANAQATLALLTQQTAAAEGQFAREADTAAGAQQRNAAAAEDMQAQLGEKLLPLYTRAQELLLKVIETTTAHSDTVLAAGAVIGGLAVAVLAANAALKVYRATMILVTAATKAWRLAQLALNLAMRANPIGIVITIIGALIAVVVKLWNENEGFRNFFIRAWKGIQIIAKATWRAIQQAVATVVAWITKRVRLYKAVAVATFYALRDAWNRVWDTIRSVASSALDALLAPIDAIRAAFDAVMDVIWSVINAIRNIRFPSPPSWMRSLGGVFGFSTFSASSDDDGSLTARTMAAEAETTQQLVAPAPYASASGGSGLVAQKNGDTININIAGALDPIGVARQIEKVVGKNMRRTGRRTLGQVTFA